MLITKRTDGLQFHIRCRPGDTGEYCFLIDEPRQCARIAEYLEEPTLVSQNGEFDVYTGSLLGASVSVCSTGIGGPSAAVVIEELFNCGVRTFVRVSSCVGFYEKACAGDIVIPSGAVRLDGMSRGYVPLEFPAIPDFEVISALSDTARAMNAFNHIGVLQSSEAPCESRPLMRAVLAGDMETATVFTVCSTLGARAGAVLSVAFNQERIKEGLDGPELEFCDMGRAIRIAVEAMKILIQKDKRKK